MVHQPLADAGQRLPDGDPLVAQMTDRSDAGAQEMRRRANCAGAQDHLPGPERVGFALWTASTPMHRGPSKRRPVTWVSAMIVRFSRIRTVGGR